MPLQLLKGLAYFGACRYLVSDREDNMYENATISISPRLWFEETLLGATLNYRASEDEDAVIFRVGMSFQSLLDCNASVLQQACLWTIRDGSLSVFGDQEELTLTFCSVQGTLIQCGASLIGEELNAFKYAVNALAYRKKVALN